MSTSTRGLRHIGTGPRAQGSVPRDAPDVKTPAQGTTAGGTACKARLGVVAYWELFVFNRLHLSQEVRRAGQTADPGGFSEQRYCGELHSGQMAREPVMRWNRGGHLLAALVLAASIAVAAEGRDVIGSLTGAHRVLMIFSPGGDGALSRQTEAAVAASRCEIEDRDLVIVRLPGSAIPTVDGHPFSRAEAADLRLQYRVMADDFLIVLVGKDGGEKFRSDRPEVLQDIFRLIDTMPMRREEMRAGATLCGG